MTHLHTMRYCTIRFFFQISENKNRFINKNMLLHLLQLWNNKTWLDFKLEPWNHDFNLHDVLTKCSKNATIFNALDINKV